MSILHANPDMILNWGGHPNLWPRKKLEKMLINQGFPGISLGKSHVRLQLPWKQLAGIGIQSRSFSVQLAIGQVEICQHRELKKRTGSDQGVSRDVLYRTSWLGRWAGTTITIHLGEPVAFTKNNVAQFPLFWPVAKGRRSSKCDGSRVFLRSTPPAAEGSTHFAHKFQRSDPEWKTRLKGM